MDKIREIIADANLDNVTEGAIKTKIRKSKAKNHNRARLLILWTMVGCTCVVIVLYAIAMGAYLITLTKGNEPSAWLGEFLKRSGEWGLIAAATAFLGPYVKNFCEN